jgi:4-diphosphocytidyl-2-C-methyl-D-erythritol kinase
MQVAKRTPGKVNLCLLVGPRDESGSHEVFTVFAPVDLHDSIEFTLEARPGADGPGRLVVECRTAPGESNLAAQALRALERHTGWALDGRVAIRKSIPVGAGMGGGSSDAACALRVGVEAIAEAGGPAVGRQELVALARALGADVAFFLDPAPAVGRGIGELLEPIGLPDLTLVLVFFERMLSTARVYRTFDGLRPGENRAVFDFRSTQAERRWRQVEDVSQVARLLENDLEPASFSLIPSLMTDREVLAREGAMAALVSGSGPTLFGLCDSKAKAEELQERMAVRGFSAKVADVLR